MIPISTEAALADLDMLGQQPLVNMYTPLCFFYPDSHEDDTRPYLQDTPTILKKGFERLAEAFPWIAGQVVGESADSGLTKIVPFPSHPIPELKIQDHGPKHPSFDRLYNSNFAFGLIDERDLCGKESHIGQQKNATTEFPVLVAQLNYIRGGIILAFVTHHSTCDITGMGSILSLFDKACRNVPFTDDDIRIGNRRLDSPIHLLEGEIDITNNPRLRMQVTPPSSSSHIAPAMLPPPTGATWVYFAFPATSLSSLKSLATSQIPENGPAYISTDDVLTALVWQRIVLARLQHKSPSPQPTICARAIDVRPYLKLPRNYPGMIQNETYTPLPPATLVQAPLGVIASLLRQDLKPKELARDTEALTTLMTHDDDKSKYSLACGVDWSRDVMISSWSKVAGYQMEFGLGAKPVKVLRPRFPPVPGLVFCMPKRADGGIDVAVCLRDEELVRLRGDEVWVRMCREARVEKQKGSEEEDAD